MVERITEKRVRDLTELFKKSIPKNLSKQDYEYWTSHPGEFAENMINILKRQHKPYPEILQLVDEVTLTAPKKSNCFSFCTHARNRKVNIVHIDEDFNNAFLYSKINPDEVASIRVHRLTPGMHVNNQAVIDWLGGESAFISVSFLWPILEYCCGKSNQSCRCYIRYMNTVYAIQMFRWHEDKWSVFAKKSLGEHDAGFGILPTANAEQYVFSY